MPTAIWKSRLRSGSAHCNLEVAVEARQCPLGSGARAGGPAVPGGGGGGEEEEDAEAEEEENSSDKI